MIENSTAILFDNLIADFFDMIKSPVILGRKSFAGGYMKKFGIVVLMALVVVGGAFAVDGTGGSLTVNATMLGVLSATIPTALGANIISFDNLAGTGDKVSSEATLTLVSNYPHYTVTFASQNASKGNLVSPSTTTTVTIPYSLKATLQGTWANAPTNSFSAFQPMTANQTISATSGNHKTPVGGVTYKLQAQLTMPDVGTEMLEVGTTFTDTVMVTIASN